MLFNLRQIEKEAPNYPGLYFLYSIRKKLVYIGKSESSIRKRIFQHLDNYLKALKERRDLYGMAKPFIYFKFIVFEDIDNLKYIEKELIDVLEPPYNNISQIMFSEKQDWRDLAHSM